MGHPSSTRTSDRIHPTNIPIMNDDPARPTEEQPRRSFLAGMAAIAIGAGAAVVPMVVGVTALLDPLRRRGGVSEVILVTRMAAIPDNGAPRKFTVEANRVDGWATHSNTPVGAVYLRRTSSGVSALNVVCPHAGCFVGLVDDRSRFGCPCHKSSFDLDGAVNDPSSPSPRAMDALDVEIRNGDEVWVRFQNFLPGRADKTPV
jgi:quinol---cytochrome c reductase iron-sulfur subunit, bacillus type